jgi:hypothetical protein
MKVPPVKSDGRHYNKEPKAAPHCNETTPLALFNSRERLTTVAFYFFYYLLI